MYVSRKVKKNLSDESSDNPQITDILEMSLSTRGLVKSLSVSSRPRVNSYLGLQQDEAGPYSYFSLAVSGPNFVHQAKIAELICKMMALTKCIRPHLMDSAERAWRRQKQENGGKVQTICHLVRSARVKAY